MIQRSALGSALALSLGCICFAAEQTASQVKVPLQFVLSSPVVVTDSHVYLGDFSRCEGMEDLCEQSTAIDFGASPLPGNNRMIDRLTVERVLKEEFPNADIVVNGSDVIKLSTDSVQLNAEMVGEALQKKIKRLLADDENYRVEISSLRMLHKPQISPNKFKVTFPLLEQSLATSRAWLLRAFQGATKVEGYVVDGSGRRVLFSSYGNVKIFALLPLAVKDLPRGKIISPSDFATGWKLLRRRGVDYLSSLESYDGYQLKRRVRAGDPISLNQIAKPFVVKRGEKMQLSVEVGGITLSSEVKALKNGAVGDVIEVEQVATRKRVRAKVMSKDSAKAVL